jgi:hypothetical protein
MPQEFAQNSGSNKKFKTMGSEEAQNSEACLGHDKR